MSRKVDEDRKGRLAQLEEWIQDNRSVFYSALQCFLICD